MVNQDWDVYISFAEDDRDAVKRIVEELEWAGVKVWFHHQPEASAESIAILSKHLNPNRAHLVVWSNDSAASGRIQAEARTSSAQKRLLAARIVPVLPPKGTKAEVYADLSDWTGGQVHRGMKKLLNAVYTLTGKGLAPDPEEVVVDELPTGNPEVDLLTDAEKDERAWQITIGFNNSTYYQHYINHFPNGKYVSEARERLKKKGQLTKYIVACAIIYFVAQILFSVIVNLANL